MRGRKLEETVVQRLTYWSRLDFHIAMVPPFARLSRGSSGSKMSSELKAEEYSPLNKDVSSSRSHWNSMGSLRKTKSGEEAPRKFLREYFELEKPSMFHERQENSFGEASNKVFELSEQVSLKKSSGNYQEN